MTDNTSKILEKLERLYPDAKPELDYTNAFELLVAAILSAQCTDKRVNIVTEKLFSLFPTPKAFAALKTQELEPYIKSCGLYHAKAANIINACKLLESDFSGNVPETREELMRLPGVGRKVANVVLSNAFGVPAIAVDTHVFRVSNRLGLAQAKSVDKTEKQLMENIPRDKWSIAHHLLIFHGRRVCKAQKPLCDECELRDCCKNPKEQRKDKRSDI